MNPPNDLPGIIRHLRQQRGWSQERLARAVDVGTLAVGKWERGQAEPTYDNRIRLAEVLDVDPATLGVGTDPAPLASLTDTLDRIARDTRDVPMITARLELMQRDIALIKEALRIPAHQEQV